MKEITKHLISKGMKQSRSDPCVFFVRDESGSLVLAAAIYVDETLVTGTKDMIDWFYDIVQEKFTITDLGELKKHLGI